MGLNDWLSVANGSMGNMKMKLFYVHEGLTDVPPPYASGLILELYQDENTQYSVKMFYHPDVSGDPVEMTLPGCEAPCPLEQWANLTKNLTPDMEREAADTKERHDGAVKRLENQIAELHD